MAKRLSRTSKTLHAPKCTTRKFEIVCLPRYASPLPSANLTLDAVRNPYLTTVIREGSQKAR